MASYSITLGEILEDWAEEKNIYSTDEIIESGRERLFPPSYPIWEEEYRKVFETNFIRRFYFVEVGFEVEGRFFFELQNWLTLNMPYFVKLWESERFEYDPLTNYDLKTEHKQDNTVNQNDSRVGNQTNRLDSETKRDMVGDEEREVESLESGTELSQSNGNRELESNATGFERDLSSSQPDERLQLTSNEDGSGVIEYADSIDEKRNTNNGTDNETTRTDGSQETERDTQSNESSKRSQNENENQEMNSRSDNTDELNRNITNLENFIEHKFGSAGVKTYPELIEDYRNSLLRLEIMIFNEMRKYLFMKLF